MFSDRINKVEKARQYAADPDRFFLRGEEVLVRGVHGNHTLTQHEDGWHCSCHYFRRYGWCAHTLAWEWRQGLRPCIAGEGCS